ncbi:hypothetical protein HDU83_002733 [Entophlyctis luteolus]|nr:hypothetical protein HDU83_002733 [Entophlyctis luteolus]
MKEVDLVEILKLSVKELFHLSDWVFFLERGAMLADPLNLEPFRKVLKRFASSSQHIVLFEHCHKKNSGSLLVHRTAEKTIKRFLWKLELEKQSKFRADYDLQFTDFLEYAAPHIYKSDLSKVLFTCESDWLGPFNISNFGKFTVDDRASPDSLRMIADYYFGRMPIPPTIKSRLAQGMIMRIGNQTKVEDFISRDGAVIFVDAWNIHEFITTVALKIKKRFVVVTGDGDECNPKCQVPIGDIQMLANFPLLRHYYAMNCDGIIAPDKMTCIPIGIKQWDDQKASMQKAYEAGLGLDRGLIWRNTARSGLNDKPVLVSFSIESNFDVRQPVYDLFCDAKSTHPAAHLMNCQFGKMSQVDFHTKLVAKSRFVISPHGNGLDCYRTYEALFFNVIPIVKTSSLDSIYENLPVLILKNWEDLTEQLLLETEIRFSAIPWDFRKLYADFWYHKVRASI